MADPAIPQIGGRGAGPGPSWTPAEANARLSTMRELLDELRGSMARLRKLHEELHRLAAFWGKEVSAADNPDRALKDRLESEWTGLKATFEQKIGELAEEGIEVKDLDTGLVDFRGFVNGEPVFLCWQQGEEEVGFYHPLSGGLRSRRPLPDRATKARPR